MRRMLFEILGPLRIQGDVWSSLPVRRALLTAFLLRPGQVVSGGELAELLWDDPPISVAPTSAAMSLLCGATSTGWIQVSAAK